jgi:hypothetical protein
LDIKSPETVRLVRYLGYCRFEPVYFSQVSINKTEEDTRGFFGREKTLTNYEFRTLGIEERFHPKAMYLDE